MSLALKTAGFLTFLSGSPAKCGPLGCTLLAVFRGILLILVATGGTLVASNWAASRLDRTAVISDITKMVDGDRFAELRDELRRDIKIIPVFTESTFGVRVELGEKLPDNQETAAIDSGTSTPALGQVGSTAAIEADRPHSPAETGVCGENRGMGDLCLMTVASVGWPGFLINLDFPATAYSIPEIVLELARSADNETFSSAKATKIRRLTEKALGGTLFLPSSPSVLIARQFNGPFQYITYFFGFLSLTLTLFSAGGSLAVNAIMRGIGHVDLPEVRDAKPKPDESAEVNEIMEITLADRIEDVPPTSQTRTPWRGGTPATDPISISRYYDRISEVLRNASSFFAVRADPPVIRFRRAGARALVNTRDTSILPSFLDAQKASILSFYDARLAMVRYLMWLVPTVGFIGTIVGVGGALSATLGLHSSLDITAAISQSKVSSSMGLAFDTTLVALAVSVVAMLFYYLVQGAEDRMVTLERDRAEEELIDRARSFVKPGTTEDLALQLVKMGVSAEMLTAEVASLNDSGRKLKHMMNSLEEGAQFVRLEHEPGRTSLGLITPALLIVIIVLLAALLLGSDAFAVLERRLFRL